MRDSRRASGARRSPRAPARGAVDLSPRHQRRRGVAARARRRVNPDAPARNPRAGRAAGAALRAWTRPGLRLLLLCVELSALVVLLASPAFAARDIEINGIHHLSRARVLQLTGLERQGSVFLVTPDQAEAAIRSDPYVESVSVRASLPGRVEVSVVEWEPLALVHKSGADYLLSAEGNVLGPAAGVGVGRAPGQPRVELTWASPGGLAPGARALNGRLLQDLRNIQDALPTAYGLDVRSIDLTSDLQLTITTRQGPRILFGQMATDEQVDSLDAKLASLKALSQKVDLAHSNLDYVNLMNPTQPVTRAVPSPSPSPGPSPSPKHR